MKAALELDPTNAKIPVLNAGTLYSDGTNHFDKDGPGVDTRTVMRSNIVRAGVEGRLANWTTRLNYSYGVDRSNALASAKAFNIPGFVSDHPRPMELAKRCSDTRWYRGCWHRVVAAKVDSSTAYSVTQRRINGVFAGLSGTAGPHSWQVNVRHDDNSQFGGSSLGYAGYGYQFNRQWRAHAGYGTSFVAPSFNQLYWPDYGNPLLEPEKGKNLELGLDPDAGQSSRQACPV